MTTPKGRWVDHKSTKITCPYGQKGSWAAGYHTGVDLAVPGSSGQRIVWAMKNAGKVKSINACGSAYGRHVLITGNSGNDYLFAHLASINDKIKPGAKVKNGQLIGKLGSTGNVTGPHLHLEKAKGAWKYANTTKPPVYDY